MSLTEGLKRITLKVRVNPPNEVPSSSPYTTGLLQGSPEAAQEIHGSDGMPGANVMRHLLDVFFHHMGAYFPSLERQTLESQIKDKTGSVFLFNCIASVAAR